MTSIALPVCEILTPRLEFPAWVRRIGDPLKMLTPLAGSLTPLGVSGVVGTPLLLDLVTGAAAAYSLRKLRNAYSGNAVTVRRSSDDAEQDIGFSGTDFDTSAFSSFVGAGSGYVKTWYDQSGNAYNASQTTTTAKQPQVILNVQNGKAFLRFDANAAMKLTSSAFGAAISQPTTIIAVAKSTTHANSNRQVFSGLTDGARQVLFYLSGRFDLFAGAVADMAAADTNYNLWWSIFNGASSKLSLNGGSEATANAGTLTLDGVSIGCGTTDSSGWNGDIAEIIVYPADKAASKSAVLSDINTYYALY